MTYQPACNWSSIGVLNGDTLYVARINQQDFSSAHATCAARQTEKCQCSRCRDDGDVKEHKMMNMIVAAFMWRFLETFVFGPTALQSSPRGHLVARHNMGASETESTPYGTKFALQTPYRTRSPQNNAHVEKKEKKNIHLSGAKNLVANLLSSLTRHVIIFYSHRVAIKSDKSLCCHFSSSHFSPVLGHMREVVSVLYRP